MLLVFFLSCVPNTDLGVTLGKLWLNIHTGAEEEVSVRRIEFVHACKSEAAVGSKTCIGLTYLELGVVNVPWQVGYHDLGLTAAERSGGSSGRRLGLLVALLGRLGDTAYRGGSSGRSSSARAASATTTAGGLRSLEDVVEALLHLV